MLDFFAENYATTVMAAIAFMIFVSGSNMESQRIKNNFIYATFSLLLLILAEVVENYFASLDKPSTMRILTSAIAYTARPAIIFFVTMIPAQKRWPRAYKLLVIPLLFDALVSFSALFTDIAFGYTPSNSYYRGPLGFTTFVVGAMYLLLLFFFSLRHLRNGEKEDNIISFAAMIIIGIGVFVEYEWSITGSLPALAVFCLIFYYVYLLISQYSTDYLTGAYNRSRMYKEVQSRKKCERYCIIFDINGLKQINDRKGHSCGDVALKTFSKAVFDCLPYGATFYRIGGDEFTIIYRTSSAIKVADLAARIEKQAAGLPFGVSYGYAHFVNYSDFDKAFGEADTMLYVRKKSFWKDWNEHHADKAV